MAVRWGRWIDHLSLWVALGAALSTGIYEPWEMAAMGLPLLAAAVVEGTRRDLGPQQRWLEIGALIFFLGDLAQGRGVFPVAIHTLFVLAGLRLALPREPQHRRQLVLMGFLLLLTTTVSTTDPIFLAWALAWFTAAALALLQVSWEGSATLRRGPMVPPPYRRVPLWTASALLIGAGFFLVLPRLQAGLRPVFLGRSGTFGQAGLGDQLDLGTGGPIESNPEVALRIAPPPGVDPAADPQWARGLALLRGITLEAVRGSRWEPAEQTPPLVFVRTWGPRLRQAEFLYTPSVHGILALPQGVTSLEPAGLPLAAGPGGSLRWRYSRARIAPVTATWDPVPFPQPEPRLAPRRLELLTRLEPDHEAARRASLRFAPGILPTPALARALEQALRGFRYTLENPSGRAANPLEDFLERTQAGHCEYFASAMALMLRARGVPARVVSGYRLGPWIPEGGYFRVSQDQAHSWIEYWDAGRWHAADPTPAAPGTAGPAGETLGTLSRWLDAVRYRWDRYVVRFSDQDQQSGFAWLQGRLQGWEWRWRTPSRFASWSAALLLAAWVVWRGRGRWRPGPDSPGRIRSLRPLLARLRRTLPPGRGETARAWLLRLGDLRPERLPALRELADAVDGEAYGNRGGPAALLAKTEAEAWRGWKAPTSG